MKVETIDEILGDAPVGVMKLDVEGSELQVLRGASRALRDGRIRHIVFEEHQGPTSEVVRLLESVGYEIFAIGWSIRGLKLGPAAGARLATAYEAPSYLATLAPHDAQARCSRIGWLTLSSQFRVFDEPNARHELHAHRQNGWTPARSASAGCASALASQGTSKEAIYRAVLSATKAAALSGEVLDFGAGTGVLMGRLLASGVQRDA